MLRQTLKFVGLTMILSAAAGSVWANNNLINVQGKLANSSGTPLSGTYTITFRLYPTLTGGTSIWMENQSVTVSTGLFNVTLGTATSMDSIAFNTPYYLGMQVAGDSNELSPRQLLGASAYALGSLGNFNASSATISQASISTATITSLTASSLTVSTITAVSSATVTNLTIRNNLTVPNGVNSTDAAAYGQFAVFQSSCAMSNTETDTSAVSYSSATNQLVTITPSATSHHILFWGHLLVQNPDNATICFFTIKRGSTDISGLSKGFGFAYVSGGVVSANVPFAGVDSPNTTSATTYQVYVQSNNAGHSCAFGTATAISTICVAEAK